MSAIEQAVTEKYGAIAAAITQSTAAQGELLRAGRLRVRRPDHLEPLFRRRAGRACRPMPSPPPWAAATRQPSPS